MKRDEIEKYRINTMQWADQHWKEAQQLPEITQDFLMDTLVLKIMLLMKQEEIDRKEMCRRIGDFTYCKMDDMSKVFLRAFSRAYAKIYGDTKVRGENKS